MSLESYPARVSQPEIFDEVIRAIGAATATPTKKYGKGVTIARTGVGVWSLTFSDFPGNFVSASYMLQDATASVVKGWTVTLGDFDATGKIVSLSIWNSTFAAADLAATSKIGLTLKFTRADPTL